eukprot:s694_g8.t1
MPRHGQSIRYIVQRLVSQFAPLGPEELNVIVVMATSAKNNLMRRAGSSPAQWVYGRNHKLPGSLLSSGMQPSLRFAAQATACPWPLFHEGQRVAYFRHKNAMDGDSPSMAFLPWRATVVAVDGSTLWIRNSRPPDFGFQGAGSFCGGEEEWWAPSQADLDLLKKSD